MFRRTLFRNLQKTTLTLEGMREFQELSSFFFLERTYKEIVD